MTCKERNFVAEAIRDTIRTVPKCRRGGLLWPTPKVNQKKGEERKKRGILFMIDDCRNVEVKNKMRT